MYPMSEEDEDSPMIIRRQNLSTILEVETPASTRPSDGTQDRLSLGSNGSGASFMSRKSLEGNSKTEPIPEEPRLENIETQMQKQVGRYLYRDIKVKKRAKIRNRYNQAPNLTQDTNGKLTTSFVVVFLIRHFIPAYGLFVHFFSSVFLPWYLNSCYSMRMGSLEF